MTTPPGPHPPAPLETGLQPRPPAGHGLLARLDALDRNVSRTVAVRWPHPRWFTLPLSLFSRSANYGILWYAVALIPLLTGGAHPWATFFYVSVAVFGVELVGAGIKRLVGRHRPNVADPTQSVQIPLPVSKSFPSSHASMSVVATFTLGSLYPSWLPALIAVTALLSFSRIYLGVHYAADVLGGVVLGVLTGVLILWLAPAPF